MYNLKLNSDQQAQAEVIENDLKSFFKAPTMLAEQAHDRVSPHIYKFMSTIKLVASILLMGQGRWRIIKNRTLNSKSDKGKHFVTIGLGIFIGDDELTLTVVNSHDGLCSIQFYLGINVHLCGNGCVFGTFLIPKLRILHKGLTYQKIDETLSMILTYIEKVEQTVNKLKSVELTAEQENEFLVEALRIRKVELSHDFTTVNKPRRVEDSNKTAWSTLQRVQENLTKGFTAINGGKVKTVQALRSPSSDLSMNVELFDAMLKIVA